MIDPGQERVYQGKRLNLGCGRTRMEGFIGVDCRPFPEVDILADLTLKWPFEDGSIDHVHASHIFEHLPDPLFTMSELYRILVPGGTAEIDSPSSNGMGAFQDPTHKSFWNINSFLYYNRNVALGSLYDCNKWEVLNVFEYNVNGIEAFGPFVKAFLRKPYLEITRIAS
jgi:SAM-dependent methyltransferase